MTESFLCLLSILNSSPNLTHCEINLMRFQIPLIALFTMQVLLPSINAAKGYLSKLSASVSKDTTSNTGVVYQGAVNALDESQTASNNESKERDNRVPTNSEQYRSKAPEMFNMINVPSSPQIVARNKGGIPTLVSLFFDASRPLSNETNSTLSFLHEFLVPEHELETFWAQAVLQQFLKDMTKIPLRLFSEEQKVDPRKTNGIWSPTPEYLDSRADYLELQQSYSGFKARGYLLCFRYLREMEMIREQKNKKENNKKKKNGAARLSSITEMEISLADVRASEGKPVFTMEMPEMFTWEFHNCTKAGQYFDLEAGVGRRPNMWDLVFEIILGRG